MWDFFFFYIYFDYVLLAFFHLVAETLNPDHQINCSVSREARGVFFSGTQHPLPAARGLRGAGLVGTESTAFHQAPTALPPTRALQTGHPQLLLPLWPFRTSECEISCVGSILHSQWLVGEKCLSKREIHRCNKELTQSHSIWCHLAWLSSYFVYSVFFLRRLYWFWRRGQGCILQLQLYWAGHEVHSGFSVRCYVKTQTNFLANLVLYCEWYIVSSIVTNGRISIVSPGYKGDLLVPVTITRGGQVQLVSGTTGNGEKRRDSPLSRFLPRCQVSRLLSLPQAGTAFFVSRSLVQKVLGKCWPTLVIYPSCDQRGRFSYW